MQEDFGNLDLLGKVLCLAADIGPTVLYIAQRTTPNWFDALLVLCRVKV